MDSLPFRLVFDGLNKLDWLTAAWGPPTDYGLATMNVGAYVGAARNITQDPNVTLAVDMALNSLRLSMLAEITNANTASPIAYSSSSAGFAGYAAVSAYYGVALHAYEGGPDTSGGGPGVGAATQARRRGLCRSAHG